MKLHKAIPLAILPATLLAATLTELATVAMQSEDEVPVAAAWSPEGSRLAYGLEKRVQQRRAPVSAEDEAGLSYPGEAWVTDFAAKPKRIVKYDLLRGREGEYVNFTVDRLAWSGDGGRLLVEITNERKQTATFLFTAQGERVKLGSSPFHFAEGYGGEWLADGETVALLTEAAAPRLLHRVRLVRVAGGRVVELFRGRTFAAAAWLARSHRAVLVERDLEFRETPRLWRGDLDSGELTLVAEVPDYLGRLAVTPDERRVSYFVGQERLAVRELAPDSPVEILPLPFGRYQWVGARVLYLEPRELGAADGYLTLYDQETETRQRLFDTLLHNFWASPDGSRVAVLTVEPPQLRAYRLSP